MVDKIKIFIQLKLFIELVYHGIKGGKPIFIIIDKFKRINLIF